MDYLRNCWNLAGWSAELPPGGMLARRLLDTPVLLFRDKAGEAKAVLDRCPHRFAPLSMGKVEDGAIVCGYHGLAFAGNGKCIHNPHGPVVSALNVTAFPVRERFYGLWIWMGDPALADDSLLPDLEFVNEAPATAFSTGYLHGQGNYQLYADNLLDLTHVDFLHPTTLGGGSITRTKPVFEQEGNAVAIKWHPRNETPSPVHRGLLGLADDDDQRVDSWTEVYWEAPSLIQIVTGVVPTGVARPPEDSARAIHVLTPESAHSTHYFFASARKFAVDDEEFNRQFAETRHRVFSTEDRPMIVGQSERMEGQDFWDLRPALLPTDAGAVRVRRILERLISQEREGAVAARPVVEELDQVGNG